MINRIKKFLIVIRMAFKKFKNWFKIWQDKKETKERETAAESREGNGIQSKGRIADAKTKKESYKKWPKKLEN